MKLFCLFVCLLTTLTSISQTCIICIKIKNSIYVAADSRTVTTNYLLKTNGSIEKIYTKGEMCKIFHFKGYNFACAGRYILDVKDEAIKAANKYLSFKEVAVNIQKAVFNRINDSLNKKAKANYAIFKESISGKTNLTQFLIFGAEKDSLIRYHIRYQVVIKDYDSSFTLNSYLDETIPSAYVFGNNFAIKEEVENKKEWSGDIKKEINCLMEKQIKADSINVGKPIQIRLSTKKGSKWIQNERPCKN